MKNLSALISNILLLTITLFFVNCTGNKAYHSPEGYDLGSPVKYNLPDELTEISGIAFHRGSPDTIFAEQDEKGDLFYFNPGSNNIQHVKFGKSGDYEDLAISNGQVIMLRSDGVLFTFPLTGVKNGVNTREWQDLLPSGEYEGLAAGDSLLYVLCKHCSIDKKNNGNTGYTLKLSGDGAILKQGQFQIDVKKIEELAGVTKMNFHPSALTQNPVSKNWFILSSVNKVLVVADADWNVKKVYALNPAVFHQPEGIAFDRLNNLYISNEGDKVGPGNLLKFVFKK